MINIYSVPNLKNNLSQLTRLFNHEDMLGGVRSRHVQKLESKFSSKEKSAIAVNHCTSGLKLALAKYEPTTVVVPSIIFFGVIGAILEAGHDYILAPVDETGNLDKSALKDVPQDYIIMNVHMNSRVSDLRDLKHPHIIDDAASAYGAKFKDDQDIVLDTTFDSVISFSYGKPLTAGEGGMIFTRDNAEYYKSKRYCGITNLTGTYGISDFEINEVSSKVPFHALGAALVSLQLENFHKDLDARRKLSLEFDQLSDFNQINTYEPGVCLTYGMRFTSKTSRDRAQKYFLENEIQCYTNHRPVFLYNACADSKMMEGTKESSLDYYEKILHISCRSDLTPVEIEHIKKHLLGLNEIL